MTQTLTQPHTAPLNDADTKQGAIVQQQDDKLTEALHDALTERQHELNNYAQIDIKAARDKNLTPLQKTIYMILCTYRNNTTNEAWPSKQTLADMAQCKPNAVRTAYRALEQAGYIKTQKRIINHKQTSNLITFPTLKKPERASQPHKTRPEPTTPYQQNKQNTTNNKHQYNPPTTPQYKQYKPTQPPTHNPNLSQQIKQYNQTKHQQKDTQPQQTTTKPPQKDTQKKQNPPTPTHEQTTTHPTNDQTTTPNRQLDQQQTKRRPTKT